MIACKNIKKKKRMYMPWKTKSTTFVQMKCYALKMESIIVGNYVYAYIQNYLYEINVQ